MESEKNARKMAREIGALYTSLERSYEKISHINRPVENPRLYARADHGGGVHYVSETYYKLTGRGKPAGNGPISTMLGVEKGSGDFMVSLIETVSEGKNWQDAIRLETAHGPEWLRVTGVSIFGYTGDAREQLV